ncbi:MAG: TIGR02206 family membrane protein [Phycisphaerae bacterium]
MIAVAGEFRFYGPDHWGALAGTIVGAAALALAVRRAPAAHRPDGASGARHAARLAVVACGGFALLLALVEVGGQWIRVRTDTWALRHSLPLHLCDIASVLCMILLIATARLLSRGAFGRVSDRTYADVPPAGFPQRLYETAYFWCLAGSVQALLTPELHFGFPRWEYLEFFVGHGAQVAAVLGLTLGLRVRPQRGSVWRTWMLTVALGVAMLPINALLGSNYMYVCGAPERSSLIDYLGPWPWSLAGLAAIGAVLLSACYAPFAWLDRRAARPRVVSNKPAPRENT